MNEVQHKDLAAGRWNQFTLCEQLGNVGSEIGRAARYVETGNTARLEGALTRAFELIDLTLADPRWQGRRREIARLREVCADTFYGNKEYGSEPKDIERYLHHFAFAARRSV